MLPYDLARDYLTNHPAVIASSADPRDVHDFLLRLHKHSMAPIAPSSSRMPASDPFANEEGMIQHRSGVDACATSTCRICGVGREVVDAREGVLVCEECGAVLTNSINIEREWIDRVDETTMRGRPSHIPGVPRALLERMRAPTVSDPKDWRSKWWDALEHWNAYVNLSTDALTSMDRMLRGWTDGGNPDSAACVVAALLYPIIRDHIQSTKDIRRNLSQRSKAFVRTHYQRVQPLQVIVDPTPKPQFACEGCDQKFHTRKEARFHCRTTTGFQPLKRKR